MKKSILLATIGFFLIGAAAPTTYTEGPDTQWRQQVDPKTDSKTGEVRKWVVTAFFHVPFTSNADQADVFFKELGTSTIDCTKDAAKTVTFTHAGKSYTLTYGALAAGMNAAGIQEWKTNPQRVK